MLQAMEQGFHALAPIEAPPQQARIAQHDEQRVDPAPRQVKASKVHLTLVANRDFEANRGLRRRPVCNSPPQYLCDLRPTPTGWPTLY